MVEMSPSNIKYSQTNFGAYDTASTPLAAVPGQISNDPYSDKHGTKLKDHRRLLSKLEMDNSRNLTPEYDYYINQNYLKAQSSDQKQSSLPKILLAIVGVAIGAVLGYKGFQHFSNGKIPKILKGTSRTGLRAEPKKIDLETFKKYSKDAIQKSHDGHLDTIAVDNLQVIMRDSCNTSEKRQHFETLYKLGKIYNYKGYQSRVVLIMPESLKDESGNIAEKFKTGNINLIEDHLIDQIEGFQLFNIKPISMIRRKDMIVVPEIGHGINANRPDNIVAAWGRNIAAFFRDLVL